MDDPTPAAGLAADSRCVMASAGTRQPKHERAVPFNAPGALAGFASRHAATASCLGGRMGRAVRERRRARPGRAKVVV